MKRGYLISVGGALLAILGLLIWLGSPSATPNSSAGEPPETGGAPPAALLRLGYVPERDIFRQRQAYLAFARYLETHVALLHEPTTLDAPRPLRVQLVTSSTYAGVLQDFQENQVDAAFVGSLVAVLAFERHSADILLKSQNLMGSSNYSGVIFVPETSGIATVDQLKGKRIGAVRTTTAGAIFPLYLLKQNGQVSGGADAFQLIWSGTHDDVIAEVVAGRLDGGAVKNTRLDAYEHAFPGVHFRRVATSPSVPDNALVVRRGLPQDVREALVRTLLAMAQDKEAAAILELLEVKSFEPCDISQYAALYDMIETLGPLWTAAGVEGVPPRRSRNATRAEEN